MKFLSMLLLAAAAINLSANMLPEKWDTAFFKVSEKDFMQGLPEKGFTQQIVLNDKPLDLDAIANGCDSAVISSTIHVKQPQKIYLGVGCKIFSLSLNGKLIYDFRKYGLGNDIENVSVSDHIIPLELTAGSNKIVFNTRRTNWRLDYCYGADRLIRWHLAVKHLKDYQPPRAELAHPEMVLRPDRNSMVFSFVTSSPIPAGVDYRKKGDKKWLREYDTVGDLVLREKSRIHKVRISNIANWGDIEYRLVLLEPPVGRDGFKRPLWTSRIYKEVYTPVKTLRNPDRKEFSFMLFGDTQLSMSNTCKTVAQREELLKKMRSLVEYRQADFLVHIGDQDSVIHNVEQVLLKGLFAGFAPKKDESVRPWLLVRGNHETNGIAAEEWFDYFQMPDDKSYYTAQIGEVLFIVLDCGDISKDDPLDAFNGPLLDMPDLFRKQAQWLANLRKSPEFRNAKYRVILCHNDPQTSQSLLDINVRQLTGDLLADNSDSGRIHLWIGGHTHRYRRAARNSRILTAMFKPKKIALNISPVNWVTVDGPKGDSSNPNFSYLAVKCTPQAIHVTAIDDTGRKIDEFAITPNGNFKEIFKDKSLQDFQL